MGSGNLIIMLMMRLNLNNLSMWQRKLQLLKKERAAAQLLRGYYRQ
jgi:hypothetical protein